MTAAPTDPMFGRGWTTIVEAQLAKRTDLVVRECGEEVTAAPTANCNPAAEEASA